MHQDGQPSHQHSWQSQVEERRPQQSEISVPFPLDSSQMQQLDSQAFLIPLEPTWALPLAQESAQTEKCLPSATGTGPKSLLGTGTSASAPLSSYCDVTSPKRIENGSERARTKSETLFQLNLLFLAFPGKRGNSDLVRFRFGVSERRIVAFHLFPCLLAACPFRLLLSLRKERWWLLG